ncbi:ABC-F family ATP-binding cassette domain-containing protein [Acetobacteraceae bacterium]|nr:ABC-F family ATP-binding cassette domain-containing protein [Acetobacteraceae bacterium]
MSILNVTNLSLRVGHRQLLDNASVTIDAGHKIGLVGKNGAGKSTLLNVISGDISPDGGSVTLANRVSMGRVKQESPSGPSTVLEIVLEADIERANLLAEMQRLEKEDPSSVRLADIHERLNVIDAYSAPARAATILSGLGFDEKAQQRPISDFSGGWRMRVSLAGVLFTEPDFLLLDEPTNHLDMEAALWLESWLKRYSGTVLLVSHDRDFLDNVTDSILHLDKGRLSLTPGGFSRFLRIRTEQALQQNRAAERVAKQRQHMEAFVARFCAKATKARQAQSRLKALARLPEIDSVIEEAPVQFDFPSPGEVPPPMLKLENVSVGYNGQAILSNLSMRIDMGDRIALLGRNGEGKSTFAKLLSGELLPLQGEFVHSSKLQVGYFAQHQQEALILTDTPLDHMMRVLSDANITVARAQLARFGLDVHRADTPVSQLSGGEKARLLLALATRHAPHLLILDEPTNHLDIDARDSLIRALMAFEGTVLLISHDSYLVEAVADQLIVAARGTVTPFDGSMEDYRSSLEQASAVKKKEKEDVPETKQEKITQAREMRENRKELTRLLAPLKKEIRSIEAMMEKLRKDQQRIEVKLADPALYDSNDSQKITSLNAELSSLVAQLESWEEKWLMKQEALEEKEREIP